MKNKKSVYLKPNGVLVVNEKQYVLSNNKIKKIDGVEHIDRTLFMEFNEKKFEKMRDFIVEKIKDSLDKKEMIEELVKKISLNEISNLYKILKTNKKKKITKQKGCLGLKIGSGKPKTGGHYLQLID